MRGERDLPLGHPSSSDFVAGSKDAIEYAKTVADNSTKRDWPKGHPGAADNPNRIEPVHPLESSRDHSRPHTIVSTAAEAAEEQREA